MELFQLGAATHRLQIAIDDRVRIFTGENALEQTQSQRQQCCHD